MPRRGRTYFLLGHKRAFRDRAEGRPAMAEVDAASIIQMPDTLAAGHIGRIDGTEKALRAHEVCGSDSGGRDVDDAMAGLRGRFGMIPGVFSTYGAH